MTLATVVAPEELRRVCWEELQARDLDVDGWIIKPRWFGIVVVATGRRGTASELSATPGIADTADELDDPASMGVAGPTPRCSIPAVRGRSPSPSLG